MQSILHSGTTRAALFPAIFSLALGGLFIGTGEFATMSLLPALAQTTQFPYRRRDVISALTPLALC